MSRGTPPGTPARASPYCLRRNGGPSWWHWSSVSACWALSWLRVSSCGRPCGKTGRNTWAHTPDPTRATNLGDNEERTRTPMADSSFDVVSKIDRQEVDNALNQTVKEVGHRFDFKGTGAS